MRGLRHLRKKLAELLCLISRLFQKIRILQCNHAPLCKKRQCLRHFDDLKRTYLGSLQYRAVHRIAVSKERLPKPFHVLRPEIILLSADKIHRPEFLRTNLPFQLGLVLFVIRLIFLRHPVPHLPAKQFNVLYHCMSAPGDFFHWYGKRFLRHTSYHRSAVLRPP